MLRRLATGGGRIATIDAAKAAPPPSPLAPVDLTDPAQVAGVMDLAARVGDILLASGTSNRDTVVQVHAVASAYGLHYMHVDITLNTITVFTTIGVEQKLPVSVFRVVSNMRTDFSKLSEVDRLIRSIQAGATSPDIATKILDGLYRSPASYGFKTSLVGWGGLAALVSVMIGGGWLPAVVSFLIGVVIIGMDAVLRRQKLPPFFHNVFGGFIATLLAAVAYSWSPDNVTPSHIIAAGIVVMLANLSLVQSLQDGITGAPVTASARFFETFLLTSAIVAGVGAAAPADHDHGPGGDYGRGRGVDKLRYCLLCGAVIGVCCGGHGGGWHQHVLRIHAGVGSVAYHVGRDCCHHYWVWWWPAGPAVPHSAAAHRGRRYHPHAAGAGTLSGHVCGAE